MRWSCHGGCRVTVHGLAPLQQRIDQFLDPSGSVAVPDSVRNSRVGPLSTAVWRQQLFRAEGLKGDGEVEGSLIGGSTAPFPPFSGLAAEPVAKLARMTLASSARGEPEERKKRNLDKKERKERRKSKQGSCFWVLTGARPAGNEQTVQPVSQYLCFVPPPPSMRNPKPPTPSIPIASPFAPSRDWLYLRFFFSFTFFFPESASASTRSPFPPSCPQTVAPFSHFPTNGQNSIYAPSVYTRNFVAVSNSNSRALIAGSTARIIDTLTRRR